MELKLSRLSDRRTLQRSKAILIHYCYIESPLSTNFVCIYHRYFRMVPSQWLLFLVSTAAAKIGCQVSKTNIPWLCINNTMPSNDSNNHDDSFGIKTDFSCAVHPVLLPLLSCLKPPFWRI